MLSTVPHSGKLGRFFVTLLQLFPPSRVTCTCPSFVPAQIRPASFADSVNAKITPAYSTPMLSGVSPPEICWRFVSLRVRSTNDLPAIAAIGGDMYELAAHVHLVV